MFCFIFYSCPCNSTTARYPYVVIQRYVTLFDFTSSWTAFLRTLFTLDTLPGSRTRRYFKTNVILRTVIQIVVVLLWVIVITNTRIVYSVMVLFFN